MHTRKKVEGVTLIGFVILLIVAGFFAYMAMRLIPMYVEYFGVLKALDQLRQDPRSATMGLTEVRAELSLKFNTQYVDENSVPPQAISLKKEAGASTVRVNYEKRVPFIYNIDLVGTFDKSVNLSDAGGE
ncbi:MAG: DUF4845 domain-containing protein [Dokdonella sp.]|uniref:DUF4845 domain-containing protein n=1 Tax=Dokdonella sp. TaxID=2291710 RepID=UPI003F7F0633